MYTGIEAAAGTWAYGLLTEARAIPMRTAGLWVSVYWSALTAGRLLSGALAGSLPAQRLVRGCTLGVALGAGLVWLGPSSLSSLLGLGLMGLACAPIFPTLIATTPARLGEVHTGNGVGVQIAAAVLGQSLLPAAAGMLANRFGLEIVGAVLFTAALVLWAVSEVLPTVAARPLRPAPAAAPAGA